MADVLNTSQEADIGSSQFAELLKPIRELTKQHCWDLNIAEKLDEYVHYIKDLDIEVNVNGEKMKLDFAKAAMVVQNSVQIYSKKVEYLWILLQEVIDSLRNHGSGGDGEEGANAGFKARRNPRKRHQKGEINLLEVGEAKYRKPSTSNKKKTGNQMLRKVQILPYEILQLEEAVGSSNPIKIKLYTMAKEHLGYPSDLRANFHFDQKDFFLQIAPKINNTYLETQQEDFPADEGMKTNDCSVDDVPPPDLDGDYEAERPELRSEDCEISAPCWAPANDPSVRDEMGDDVVERMQLRPRDTPQVMREQETVQNLDPWQSLEIYVDMSIRRPVGTQPTTKLPQGLQNRRKRKEVGKDAVPVEDEVVTQIHEFLGDKMTTKKIANKICQPEGEYWEEYVFYSKSIGAAVKRHLKTRSAGNVTVEDLDETSEHEDRADVPEPDDRPDISFNDDPRDDFHFDGDAGNDRVEDRDGDEAASRDFYEILQQQMTEYMATAKAFVSSTESTRRVQAWHDMIRPRLLEAESRRDFDIHEYGSHIISVFGSEAPIGTHTRFSQVVRSQPKNEVARYFLATLQLANAYNVEIESESNSMSVDGVQLKLLSRERHHEHMDEFR